MQDHTGTHADFGSGMDPAVARHYGNPQLEVAILGALTATGRDIDHLQPDDLLTVDEFHIGGVQSARDLALAAGITAGSRVLDVGSGIGGPARLFASHYGATVVGVDVTPEFVRTAASLTERTGLADQVAFVDASALNLPFADEEFDVATLLHVGMNIADKGTAFAEVARVLRPGGVFAIYDVMRSAEGDLAYPLPWAATAAISFPASRAAYEDALGAAGFTVERHRDLRDAGIEFIEAMPKPAQGERPSPLGMHLVLGPDGRTRMTNLLHAMKAGLLAPVELIARKS
ncbi:SAM-dependent methyltransferase [Mycetocola sp. CAN_C7]|uniref:class I SAM-dependent methyltransferase n=1 Tax=Mycetocola sp. CAN_C7 TaxID=2787724 RepID=UPI0018C8E2CD